MKMVSNYGDPELRTEQLNVFIDVINGLKSKEDLKIFVTSFFTESEKAYLGQRLNIMRMLSKYFTYSQIMNKLHVPNSTISHSSKLLERADEKFKDLVLSYKFKKSVIVQNSSHNTDIKPFVKPHYPGAIKL